MACGYLIRCDVLQSLGPETPLYETPKKGYSALELLNLLFGKVSKSMLCTRKPCKIQTFASFVVDLAFGPYKDLQADDNGSWVTASPRRRYVVERNDGKIISAMIASELDDGDEVVTLYRQYGRHKGEPAFRRIIATASDASGKQISKAIVQYYFIGGHELPVHVPAHGNASRNPHPYYKTQRSTLNAITQECDQKSPSLVYHRMFEVAGGTTKSKSASEEPRNIIQVYNARKKLTAIQSKDELFDLLEKLQNHQSSKNGGILREVVVGTTPCAILASKEQLESLVLYCCHPGRFGVLGIDATFELGDFYVTLMTYSNLMLQKPRTGKPPVFIGPAFLHMQRRFEDYHTFFSCLLKLEPRLAALKAYGTDGEGALVSALEACFKESVSLRCFIHKQRNLEEHLKSASTSAKKEVLLDIFGMWEGDVFNLGLVDSENQQTFDRNLNSLHKRWDNLVPGFFEWFSKHQAETFRKHMIADVREKALLGSPHLRGTPQTPMRVPIVL